MNTTPANGDPLRLVSSCPLCEAKFGAAQARVLSERQDTRLIHVTCRKCGSATLALVVQTDSGGSTVGMVTDLTHEDVLRLREGRRVSMDDVIDLHQAFAAPAAEALRVSLPKRRPRAKAPVASRRHA